MKQRVLVFSVVALCALATLGCPRGGREASHPAPSAQGPAPTAAPARFVEVAAAVGIDFVHGNGAFGEKWLPETMGSGCAFWDYDGDGDPDVLLLSGADWPGHETGGRDRMGLFRNDGGRFTEVTQAVGLARPLHAMGATYGDYDSDGDSDLFVTAVGPDRLYRNEGGRFEDVAEAMGLAGPGFGSSAAWFDHDRDGDLDLVVLDYVDWSPETDLTCTLDGETKSYCTPESYAGASPRLYRNDGARFVDVTEQARLFEPSGKGLGVVVIDYDGDGLADVFVANDTQPNFLFHAEADGTYTEQAALAGVAFDEAGHARGAMGVDAGDWLGSGRPGFVIGNFSNEMISLYRNEGGGRFVDVAPESGIGPQSLKTLAFGTFFFDHDLDGLLDVFVANGHLEPDIERIQPELTHAQPPHLFHNLGAGRFTDVAPTCEDLQRPMVARGSAFGDFDGDGDLDVLVSTVAGRARLFRNDVTGRRSLRVRLEGGAGSNRDGYGCAVEVDCGGRTQWAWSRSGHSYCSQSERVLTFGLGQALRADEVRVRWPSGKRSRVTGVPAGTLVVRERDAG